MTSFVTAVVCAAFDARTDAAVLAVRDLVVAAGVRLPARPRHRPHLTLAAVRLHPDQLIGVVELAGALARSAAPIAVSLDHVGTFGRAGALWLGPAESPDLCTLQRSVHDTVERSPWASAFGGRTAPGAWVPHCSLATRLDRATLERTRSVVDAGFSPIDAVVTGLAVVLVGGTGDVGLVELSGDQPGVVVPVRGAPARRPVP